MMENKPAYYSHSMRIYNTEREAEELDTIEELYGDVINPNGDITWRGSMEPYFKAVRRSCILIFSQYKGYIGRGVFDEIQTALRNNIPVRCLKLWENGSYIMEIHSIEVNDPGDWAVKYGNVIW